MNVLMISIEESCVNKLIFTDDCKESKVVVAFDIKLVYHCEKLLKKFKLTVVIPSCNELLYISHIMQALNTK